MHLSARHGPFIFLAAVPPCRQSKLGFLSLSLECLQEPWAAYGGQQSVLGLQHEAKLGLLDNINNVIRVRSFHNSVRLMCLPAGLGSLSLARCLLFTIKCIKQE